MSAVVEKTTPFFKGFDEADFTGLGAGEPVLLRAKREEAFQVYAGMDVPTLRTEEYRRTNPDAFGFGKFRLLAAGEGPADPAADPWDEHFDVVVSVNGARVEIQHRSDLPADQLRVLTLEQAAASCPELIEKHLRGAALSGGDRKFQALADAFWNVGLFVHIGRGAVIEKGVLIRHQHAVENTAIVPRLLLIAEENSQCNFVEHYRSEDGVPFLAVCSREFYLGRGANVKLISVQEWGDRTNHLGEDWARVEGDATISLLSLTLGGKTSKLTVGCDVCERNANAYLGGLYFAEGRQHFDQKTLQRHSAPNTYSNMLYKGAVKDKGHSVYQGFIQATRGSIGVDAYQTNNNLILNDGARADSIPGLIIDADDLACSHGATMGNLDPDQIYYLRSRGIDEGQARRMLVMGFFEEVVARVPYEIIRDRLHEVIESKFESED